MRYFYSLFSENLRFTQNLPNEVFLTIYDFKVDIPYKKTLRITLLFPAFQSHHFDGKVEKTILYKCPLKLSFCLGKIEDTSLENVSRYLHLTTQMQMTAV